MRERESIILLLFLFQIYKGIVVGKKTFNQELMSTQDFGIHIYVLDSRYESVLQIPSDIMTYYQIKNASLLEYIMLVKVHQLLLINMVQLLQEMKQGIVMKISVIMRLNRGKLQID